MNRIEQTTLSIEDIREHSNRLSGNEQERDDMLERFVNTFLADEPERMG